MAAKQEYSFYDNIRVASSVLAHFCKMMDKICEDPRKKDERAKSACSLIIAQVKLAEVSKTLQKPGF